MIKDKLLFFFILLACFSCSDDDNSVSQLNVLSITADGSSIADGQNEVGLNPNITITFDAAIATEKFENSFNISPSASSSSFSYGNANTRVTINLELEPSETFNISIEESALGARGEVLSEPINFEVKTNANTIAACTSASSDCLGQLIFEDAGENYSLDYYANYPISEEVNLDQIEKAIILVHGANRNNDEYFQWMINSLNEVGAMQNTLLISPKFKDDSEAAQNELYWNSNNWREGTDAQSGLRISSFEVVDSLIARVARKANNLSKVLITGHSSGGLFTHGYATANKIENQLTSTSFDYIVANSQYFYYPGSERVNENSNELYEPTDCGSYDFWPFGFNSIPNYLANTTEATLNDQLTNRSVYYLLGNGNQSDPSLNTSDCGAVLLGSTRYQRGENMFYFINQKFPDNNSKRVIVEGIGHNGQAIYQSTEFRDLLSDLLDQ